MKPLQISHFCDMTNEHPQTIAHLQDASQLPIDAPMSKHIDRVTLAAHGAKRPRRDWWTAMTQHRALKHNCDAVSIIPLSGQVATGSPECLERFPSLRALSLSRLAILMDAAPFLPEYGSPKLVEVGQTIGRHEAKEDACGTLIPKVLAEDVIVPT
jgi:hypothetical protein